MIPTTAYISEFSRQSYATPDACLSDEFHALKESVAHHIRCLMLIDGVTMDVQLDALYPKLKMLREKAREWKEARDARIESGELPPTEALRAELHARDDRQRRIRDQLTRIAKGEASPPNRTEIADSEMEAITWAQRVARQEQRNSLATRLAHAPGPLADPAETPANETDTLRRAA